MKKTLSLILTCILLALAVPCSGVTKAKSAKKIETVSYDVFWHWGFIWKKAGSGVGTLWQETGTDNKERLHAQISGRSHSIVETIMKVRDTLEFWSTPNMIPIEYCKKTYEGSYHAIERNYYKSFTNGKELLPENVDSTQVEIYRWRVKKGNDRKHHSCEGIGYDMLSVFYLVRDLDYEHMKVGTQQQFRIHAGIRAQWLTMIYKGKTTYTKRDGKKYDVYAVDLTFASKDSDDTPLNVWISTSAGRRPIGINIDLNRIGAIQAEIVE